MNKITLNNYEKLNQIALEKHFSRQYSLLNEYFYIQEHHIINNLLDKIKGDTNNSEKDIAHFLTGFFWNQQQDEYAVAENIGKFLLRLNSFQDSNTLIEVKTLSLEEKINFVHNMNKITHENKYLSDMFNLKGQRFSDKIKELLEDKSIIENIETLYCTDWIDQHDMLALINREKVFLTNLDLNIKLNSQLTQRKDIKRHKI